MNPEEVARQIIWEEVKPDCESPEDYQNLQDAIAAALRQRDEEAGKRITELTAENERLRNEWKYVGHEDSQGMVIQPLKSTWDNMKSRIAQLEAAVRDARNAVQEEVNLSNYDHETICRINRMWDEAIGIIDSVLSPPRPEGGSV